MRVVLIGISRDIEFDLRNDLFSHLVSLSGDFYARHRTGDIMARATNDLNAVRMMLGPGVMYWTETSLTFVLAIAVMASTDWRLALLAILPAPLVSFAVIFFGRKIHDRFERIQAMFSDISSRVQENLSGVRMIRAYAQEAAELRKFNTLNRGLHRAKYPARAHLGLFEPLLELLIGSTFLIVLWAGGQRVLSGRISLGSFVMFNTYMGMLVWPMIAMGWVVNLMQRGSASLERINQIMDERPSIAAPARPRPLTAVRGEIEFRGVSVIYPAGARARRNRPADPGGLDGRDRRRYRLRQEHAGEPDPAAARSDCGRRAASMESICAACRRRRCGGRSVSFRRRRFCSAPLSPTTSPSASSTRPKNRSAAPRSWPVWPPTSKPSRPATRPWWASAALRSPAARSSAPRSPGQCCAIRGS